MLSQYFLEEVDRLRAKFKISIEIIDFRRVTFDPILNNPNKERHSLSEYIIFDLGEKSYLDPISTDKNIFRVTNYDPDRLGESHKKGIHKYCITKELFDSDIVISIPKVKTHQKTGITCALKNLVGLNGDKDYLPHHRFGGTGFGGDCYPGKNYLRILAERVLDSANRKIGRKGYRFFLYLGLSIWKLSNPKNVHSMAAGWYGNDTTWRMVLDLNKIAIYGKVDGTLAKKPQRTLFSLIDGVIAGQGDGPLNPTPLPLGIIAFTDNSHLNDICRATLMGFNPHKFSLLRNGIDEIKSIETNIMLNGEVINITDLSSYSTLTLPPQGWIDYLN
jgi:hypothetical protein